MEDLTGEMEMMRAKKGVFTIISKAYTIFCTSIISVTIISILIFGGKVEVKINFNSLIELINKLKQ